MEVWPGPAAVTVSRGAAASGRESV